MNISNREKFQLLMKQIGIADDMKNKYFQNGSIEKLSVFRADRLWHFHFQLEQSIPADIYQIFILKLTEAFSSIAKVTWTISVTTPNLNDEEWMHYWQIFTTELIHTS